MVGSQAIREILMKLTGYQIRDAIIYSFEYQEYLYKFVHASFVFNTTKLNNNNHLHSWIYR